MPPSAKKRKTNATTPSKPNPVAPSLQRGIQAYGRISKSQPGQGKSTVGLRRKDQLVMILGTPEASSTSTKRKASEAEEDANTEAVPTKRLRSQKAIERGLPDAQSQLAGSRNGRMAPKTPRKERLSQSIPVDTPTKGARSHFESLDLSSSPCSIQESSPPSLRADTPASSPVGAQTPEPAQAHASELPEELQDLIDLHSSFLTALSLHFIHHGSLTPADFHVLRPNVERSWRKRRVSLQDIQQILAIQETAPVSSTTLSLSDYGHGKVCIEILTPLESIAPQKRLLNEEDLNANFATSLLNRWNTFATSQPTSGSVEDFINCLPLLSITPCASATLLAPLLAKGQRRLEDLKSGAIRAQARSQPSTATFPTDFSASDNENDTPVPTVAKSNDTFARKSSLLDRIKQKEAARETDFITHLTPSQRLRLAALHRVDEIVPVLDLLVSSSSSAS
ncbi:MAG: hypothetical protein Q9218_001325, partial [Villophora microphyllina]